MEGPKFVLKLLLKIDQCCHWECECECECRWTLLENGIGPDRLAQVWLENFKEAHNVLPNKSPRCSLPLLQITLFQRAYLSFNFYS